MFALFVRLNGLDVFSEILQVCTWGWLWVHQRGLRVCTYMFDIGNYQFLFMYKLVVYELYSSELFLMYHTKYGHLDCLLIYTLNWYTIMMTWCLFSSLASRALLNMKQWLFWFWVSQSILQCSISDKEEWVTTFQTFTIPSSTVACNEHHLFSLQNQAFHMKHFHVFKLSCIVKLTCLSLKHYLITFCYWQNKYKRYSFNKLKQ